MSVINGNLYWCKITVTTIYELEVEADNEMQASFKAGTNYQVDGKQNGPNITIQVEEVR